MSAPTFEVCVSLVSLLDQRNPGDVMFWNFQGHFKVPLASLPVPSEVTEALGHVGVSALTNKLGYPSQVPAL